METSPARAREPASGSTPGSSPGLAPGRRWFLAGSIVMLLFGCTHSVTVIKDFFGSVPAPFVALDEAMRAATVKMGPFVADVRGLQHILSISYSLLILTVAAIDLTMLKPAIAAGRLRTLAGLNFTLAAGLFGVSLAFQFPPPMVFALLAAICFFVAMLRAPRAATA